MKCYDKYNIENIRLNEMLLVSIYASNDHKKSKHIKVLFCSDRYYSYMENCE